MIPRMQRELIYKMHQEGSSYQEIARSLGLSPNTVKSICQRQRLQSFRQLSQEVCKNCGKPLTKVPGRKPREFCSERCRYAWWNRDRARRPYVLVCQQCGKEFVSYGNRGRKYCGRECYLRSRYGEGLP